MSNLAVYGFVICVVVFCAVCLSLVLHKANEQEQLNHELDTRCYPMTHITSYQDNKGNWHAVCATANGGSEIK
jgi:hypothetical protein